MADINNLVGSVADEEIIVGEVSTADELVGDASTEESVSGDISVGNKYQGESAYEVAVRNGFEGSEEEWLQSLHGADGEPGKDGFSPVVAVEDIDGGHRVSITDKDGVKTFDVMDGKDGGGGGGGVTSWDDLTDKPDFAPIATSGSWNDLTDKPFGETPPAFDITWDGNMAGHETFEFGEGVFFVKVSDDVYTPEQVLGATIFVSIGEKLVLTEEYIDTDRFVGAITCGGEAVVIVHSAADLTNAMGIPDGVVTNGVWFFYMPEAGAYVNRFVGATEITKIDEKFLPDDISGGVCSWNDLADKPEFATVATSGDYNDLEDRPNFAPVATSGSWNDLKDRPFYDNSYEDVVCFDGYSTITSPTVYVSFNRPLTVGATYKIEINGTISMLTTPVIYSTTAIAVTSKTFDNFSDSGWSSSEVFGSPYIVFPFNTAFAKLSNCTIRIAEMVTEVKVLDEKYLPMDAIVTNVLNALPIYDGEVIEE